MTDRLLQCLRLLALVLACYGWLRFWMRCFRLPVELALPVNLCALGLGLFAAGCLGILLPVSCCFCHFVYLFLSICLHLV